MIKKLYKRAALLCAMVVMIVSCLVMAPLGSQTAEAACGTYYQYANPDRILSYSYNCTWYFDANGWNVYAYGSDGTTSWWWLRPGS